MTIILHRHCRELGYCNRGLRQWFVQSGLDWPAFLKHGIAADVLREHGNAMAERAIALAEGEVNGE